MRVLCASTIYCTTNNAIQALFIISPKFKQDTFEPGDTKNPHLIDTGVAMRSKANTVSTATASSFPDLFTLEYEDYI